MASAKQIAREMAEEWAPVGLCTFCGADNVPVVSSEVDDKTTICESCADGAICAFLTRSSFLAPLRRRAGKKR
jgi:hypothetical protein